MVLTRPYRKPLRGTRLNVNHPLSRGLVGCWIFNEGTGSRFFNHSITKEDFTGFPGTWEKGGARFDGSDDGVTISAEKLQTYLNDTDEITSAVLWQSFTRPTWDQGILATNFTRPFHFVKEGGSTIGFRIDYTGGTWSTTASCEAENSGDWSFGILTGRSGEQRAYLDGTEVGTAGTETGTLDAGFGSDNLMISSSNTWNGILQFAFIWNRFFTPEDAQWFYREPYAMFYKPRYYAVAGGEALTASLADTVGITDSISDVLGGVRSVADSVGISDALTTAAGKVTSLADTVGVTDTLTRLLTGIRAIADTVGITDVIATATGKVATLADAVGITDTIATIMSFVRSITDVTGITDALTRLLTGYRTVTDTVGATDTISTTRSIIKSIADTIGITDSLSAVVKIVAALSDAVGITDVLSRIGTFIRSISDAEGITDVLSRTGAYIRSLTDTEGITDTITTFRSLVRSISDVLGITDLIEAVAAEGIAATIAKGLNIKSVLESAINFVVSLRGPTKKTTLSQDVDKDVDLR